MIDSARPMRPGKRSAWQSIRRHASLRIGLVLVGLIVAMAFVSLASRHTDAVALEPFNQTITARLEGPSWAHPFGTDQYGRDLLARVMYGSINALYVGLVSVGIGMTLGVLFGVIAGYEGRWLDEGIMRAMDVLYGFPAVLTAILLTARLGPGITTSMVAIGLVNVPIFARLTRGNVLALRERDFVQGARAIGAGPGRVIRRHILPNALAPLIVQTTISFAMAILAEAGLSYLGLGTQPPQPSWGVMLRDAQSYLALSVWPAVFPGLAIAIAVLGFNLTGDGLRDALDPRLRNIR